MGKAIESCTRGLSRNPKNSYHSRFPARHHPSDVQRWTAAFFPRYVL